MPQSNVAHRPPLLTLIAAVSLAARVDAALAVVIGGLPSVMQELIIRRELHTLPRGSVVIIHGRADLALLRDNVNATTVILRNTNLAEEVSLRLAIGANERSAAVSLIVFGEVLTSIDLALPSLRLELDATGINSVHKWLANDRAITESLLNDPSDIGVRFSADLKDKLLKYDDAATGSLIGTVLLRLMAGLCQLCPQRRDANVITLLPQDYDCARSLLELCDVRPGGDPANPLALAMARRASMWLRENNMPNSITRREVVDLGNSLSRTCKELIKLVLGRYDHTDPAIHLLGFSRKPSLTPGMQHDLASDELRSCLMTWSLKQVRTHFHQLSTDGLLTAEKDGRSWKYMLPESLKKEVVNWRHLPTANALFGQVP